MKLKHGEKWILAIAVLYFSGFAVAAVMRENYEFLLYELVMVGLLVAVFGTLQRSRFGYPILTGLTIWGFLHLAGGMIPVGDTNLYGTKLIDIVGSGELTLLKYDQVVHIFGFAVATLVAYHILRRYLVSRSPVSVIIPIVILIGMGLGVVNEIIEFSATLLFEETGVGGYDNTMLDLVFNTLGAIIAALYARGKYKKNPQWGER